MEFPKQKRRTKEKTQMKRTLACMLAVLLLLPSLAGGAEAGMMLIEGALTRNISIKSSYRDNPVIPGVSSTTGLPFSGTYVPILFVLDNAPQAYPHWGVGDADVIYQAPNGSKGATKLLALFADKVPEAAGGSRSGRIPFFDVARSWGAVFVFGGAPPRTVPKAADLISLVSKHRMFGSGMAHNINTSNEFSERVTFKKRPHNLSGHLLEIKEDQIARGTVFEERPFLFSDEPRSDGVPATFIDIKHYGEKKGKVSNAPSDSSFTFDPQRNSYTRTGSTGVFVDRNDPDAPIEFANVIVQRTRFSYPGDGFVLTKHVVGTGAAEIFINGRYIAGAWYRKSETSRTVYLDEKGKEIALQRGKTFIIITNDVTEVFYRP